ncbi:DUF3800 domain-containing protein [Lactiplantibacillus plantarum]|uniref:DUF3800 domain-containing protein n=1 Tax=Lactiplantibacillus plantarum TaxID=1590 RepID=UPI001D0846BA|nr:DUF3800 domain-containing protein [Lactiplantibacillus plantarum]MCB7152136.1 DUF3800 domain-containing protein [Lactiplantibacillus plantarum]MCB7172385.1 DUF3800 domain-containing protein [Lactiplantibacillus plantarum]MCG0820604.1 hypothetical protein [Lactiplantibacillus plantarum]MCG0880140.1 hypothetical protein [Lactiplantibacillus plantarum]MCW6143813.1 DUF3800 domain-containing protein [Lactiplantibacillus plantarum]
MKTVWFFLDDSGVLHNRAQNKIFVYAGYSFIDKEEKEDAKRRYRDLSHKIHDGAHIHGEVKASKLGRKDKAKLYRVMKRENSLAATVKISDVYNSILGDKRSIHRYKDYVMKRIIKKQIKKYIDNEELDPDEDLKINIFLDEQATSTNGIYTLEDSIYEELAEGIQNFDYGNFYHPIIRGNVEVSVKFCDSSCNFLIQSADILANRIWTSYMIEKREMRDLTNHIWLHLP